MMNQAIENIRDKAKKIAEIIKSEKGKIQVVTHHDADGICSGTIMYKALETIGKDFQIDVVRQLEDNIIQELSSKDADLFIFTDLGSGQKENINKYLSDRKVVIADHHTVSEYSAENINELNCHDFGIDGKDEVSGAGMTYFLCREITPKICESVEFTLIGAAGDTQKKNGQFKTINKYLFEEADRNGRIKVINGLRLFGRFTRPLHKSLMYLDRPKIPNVNGNESGAIQMMNDLEIPAKKTNGDWTRLHDLSKEEESRLTIEIILRSELVDNKDYLTGNVYVLTNDHELREFATMLNACGRLGKGKDGLDLCLGKKDNIDDTLREYRQKIAKYLNWVSRNKESIIHKKNGAYLVARDKIDENFIGTIMSIISKSADNKMKIMFGFANSDNGVKVSGRVDSSLDGIVDIDMAIRKVVEEIGGEGGGHSLAAGAKIAQGVELEFIEKIDLLLDYDQKKNTLSNI